MWLEDTRARKIFVTSTWGRVGSSQNPWRPFDPGGRHKPRDPSGYACGLLRYLFAANEIPACLKSADVNDSEESTSPIRFTY